MNQSINRDSVGQSADLRTRIAAAIHAGLKDQEDVESHCGTLEKHADGGAWTAMSGVYDLAELADAVIRELRLKPVEGTVSQFKGRTYRRYITDWLADA